MSETIKIRLPQPFPVQQKILDKASRFNAVCLGEDGGKTTLGIEVLIGARRGAFEGDAPVAWFSPTKDALEEVKRAIKRARPSSNRCKAP